MFENKLSLILLCLDFLGALDDLEGDAISEYLLAALVFDLELQFSKKPSLPKIVFLASTLSVETLAFYYFILCVTKGTRRRNERKYS